MKAYLILVPLLSIVSVPLYDWSWDGIMFVIYGLCVGVWLCALVRFIRSKRHGK